LVQGEYYKYYHLIKSLILIILLLSFSFFMDKKKRTFGILKNNESSVVAFGKAFLANADFVQRFQKNTELNEPNPDTFYTSGEEGYLDYPLVNH